MTQQMIVQLGLSAGLVAATVVLHGVMIVFARLVFHRPADPGGFSSVAGGTLRLMVIALWLFLAHAGASALWAVAFLKTGVSADLEEAVYFAMTTYTTLGFGDVIAPEDWRLLTGAASMNGLLLFGVSAAVLVEAAERLRYRPGA